MLQLSTSDLWGRPGGTAGREGATVLYSSFSTPSRMFSDEQQTKQINKSLIPDLNYHLLNLLTAASSVKEFQKFSRETRAQEAKTLAGSMAKVMNLPRTPHAGIYEMLNLHLKMFP